jgi:thiamine biosynthesis lipoprotein
MKSFLLLSILLTVWSCADSNPEQGPGVTKDDNYIRLSGSTMGTTFNITYKDDKQRNFESEINELLKTINDEVSTYEKNSTISKVNASDKDTVHLGVLPNEYFIQNFKLAKEVYETTEGSFDPTVMPLVNYWGFGTSAKRAVTEIDKAKVDSLKNYVGFERVQLIEEEGAITILKENAAMAIDFSACAKGGGVDAIGAFFVSNGIGDYLVDIGGELVARGKSPRGKEWKVGVSVPKEGARSDEIHSIVSLTNMAIATSGNHRNYYQTKGYKYGHTLNPKTGFPEKNDLLSATVFTTDCMKADAYATAFMVMGLDKAYALASQLPEMEAFFIYGKPDGSMGVKYTEGADKYLKQGDSIK